MDYVLSDYYYAEWLLFELLYQKFWLLNQSRHVQKFPVELKTFFDAVQFNIEQ